MRVHVYFVMKVTTSELKIKTASPSTIINFFPFVSGEDVDHIVMHEDRYSSVSAYLSLTVDITDMCISIYVCGYGL